MDLFFQPKICWKAVGHNLAFAIVEQGIFRTAPASFISAGINNDYILSYLCSRIGKYFIYQNSDTTGAGDIMLNIQSLVKFPIPYPINKEIVCLSHKIQQLKNDNLQKELDSLIYKSYGLDKKEIAAIERV